MNANLQNTKTKLIQWLSAVEDSVVLEKILAIKNSEDWWDKISIAEKNLLKKAFQMQMAINYAQTIKLKTFMEDGYKILWTDNALLEL